MINKVKKEKPIISKHKTKMLIAIEQIGQETPLDADSVVYMSQGFTTATMPHRKVEGQIYNRKNGNYQLCMMAFPDQKIPYGVIPRLFIIWLITEIVRTKRKEIELGSCFSEFLKKLKFDTGGYTGKRVKEQIAWLSSVSVGFLHTNKKVFESIKPESIIEHARIWWIDDKNDTQQQLFPSSITVSESFYNEAMKAFPVDMRIVDALRNSAMKLDIYLWLTLKMYNVKRDMEISYAALKLQFGADYEDTPKGLDNFRTKFRTNFKAVLNLYSANVDLTSPQSILLHKSETSVPKIRNDG